MFDSYSVHIESTILLIVALVWSLCFSLEEHVSQSLFSL